jgi:hypothetical protein
MDPVEAPEVAVTVMVYVPVGVPETVLVVPEELEPPPHAAATTNSKTTPPNPASPSLLSSGDRIAEAASTINRPNALRTNAVWNGPPPGRWGSGITRVLVVVLLCAVVVTDAVKLTGKVPFTATGFGLTPHVASVGKPVHVIVAEPEKPSFPMMLSV